MLFFIGGIIVLIIGLSNTNKKLSITGGIMTGTAVLLFLAVLFINIFSIAHKVGNIAHKVGDEIKNYEPEHSEMMEKIHEYALDTTDIPEDFYLFYAYDYYHTPLPYPYFIKSTDNRECGKLCSDWEFKSDYKDLGYITHLVFDRNYLLVRTSSEDWDNLENGTIRFKIFNFRTNATYSYDSSDKMEAKARKLGFEGEVSFLSLSDYFWEL